MIATVVAQTALLLAASKFLMLFAWYGHLKRVLGKQAVVRGRLHRVLIQVPANRLGYTTMTLPQLKILQEANTLAVFVPFSVLYMQQAVKLDDLRTSLCIRGAV